MYQVIEERVIEEEKINWVYHAGRGVWVQLATEEERLLRRKIAQTGRCPSQGKKQSNIT